LLYLLDGRRTPDLKALIEETLALAPRDLPNETRQGLEAFYAAIDSGTATAGLAGALLHDIESARNDDDAHRRRRSARGGRDGQA